MRPRSPEPKGKLDAMTGYSFTTPVWEGGQWVVPAVAEVREPVAPRGDLIARLKGLTSDRAVRDPSNQQGRRVLSKELTGSAHQ